MKNQLLSSDEVQNFGGENSRNATYLEKSHEVLCFSVVFRVLLLPSGFC